MTAAIYQGKAFSQVCSIYNLILEISTVIFGTTSLGFCPGQSCLSLFEVCGGGVESSPCPWGYINRNH